MNNTFVLETDNNRTPRLIALLLVVILVLAGAAAGILSYLYAAPATVGESVVQRYTPGILADLTPLKQFIISTMSGMIIFPLPNEAAFYMGLHQGNAIVPTVAATVAGFVLGNIVSYLLGRSLSKHIVYLLSTRQIYELRRRVNKYGVYAILVINLLPAPSDVLTFGLGMTRYNAKRLFSVLIFANIVKFSVYAYAIHLIS